MLWLVDKQQICAEQHYLETGLGCNIFCMILKYLRLRQRTAVLFTQCCHFGEITIRIHTSCLFQPCCFVLQCLLLRHGSDEVRRVTTPTVPERPVLVAEQFMLHAERRAAQEDFVEYSRYDQKRGEMSFWLLISIFDFLLHFDVFKIAERMQMDPLLGVLVFHQTAEFHLSSPCCSDAFVARILSIGDMSDYRLRSLPQ